MSQNSNETSPWDAPAWVSGFVRRIFFQRGYKAGSDEILELIEAQWSNWKALMLETGLIHDREAAERVAYQFATQKVIGGAGRIFENFAEFVREKPKAVREFEDSRFGSENLEGCTTCDNQGVILAPVANRTGRLKHAAFACDCQLGRTRYAGIPQATPEITDWKRTQDYYEQDLAREWIKSVGLDPDKPVRFSEFWSAVKRRAVNSPGFAREQRAWVRSIDLSTKTHNRDLGDARAVYRVPSKSEEAMAFSIFENGDERGWSE